MSVALTLFFIRSAWWWLEHDWIISPSIFWAFHNPNWRTHIFQSGFVNHQLEMVFCGIILYDYSMVVHLMIDVYHGYGYDNVALWWSD